MAYHQFQQRSNEMPPVELTGGIFAHPRGKAVFL
jgi:hypothetical protein